MTIDDFKDTVELDNVTRQLINKLRKEIEEDDSTIIRFAVFLAVFLNKIKLNEEVNRAMGQAMILALADPAQVEQDLFRKE